MLSFTNLPEKSVVVQEATFKLDSRGRVKVTSSTVPVQNGRIKYYREYLVGGEFHALASKLLKA